ncbi:MAG: S1C family serine protease, partial [Acidimicrobiales bacterium]
AGGPTSGMSGPSGPPSGLVGAGGYRQPPNTWAVAGISALIAGLVSAGMVVAVIGTRDPSGSSALPVERQMVRPRTGSSVAVSPVVEMAERLRPAIVQLKVERANRTDGGTGVVFRSDGHVLTNAQLVAGASAIRAVTANGRELNARLVGVDPETDTGVVKLEGGPFPVATLGSAVDLRVGQPAVAVGLPVGVAGGPSVTGGMISALHREIRLQKAVESGVEPVAAQGPGVALVDMIQTDAPIPPGSPGGALLDANGAVIGITTTAGAADSAGAFAFATAIDVAHSVADELIRTGKVVHSWLGIEGGDVDGTTAADLDLEGGAVVVQVKPGSPAERGGLQPRDVIVALGGQAVQSMGEVVAALRSSDPGATLRIEVVRDGRHRSLVVTLVERPPTS